MNCTERESFRESKSVTLKLKLLGFVVVDFFLFICKHINKSQQQNKSTANSNRTNMSQARKQANKFLREFLIPKIK